MRGMYVRLWAALSCLALGQISFLESNLTVLESTSTHFIGLNRSGSSGNVSAYLTVLNGSTAIQGVHFDFVPNPVVFRDGEVGPKGAAIFVYDNDVWEPTKVVRFGIITDPPEAAEANASLLLEIQDDYDGGTIVLDPARAYIPEALPPENVSSCAIFAERQGAASGVTHLWAAWTLCNEQDWPEVKYNALDFYDHGTLGMGSPVQWADGETGRKCLVDALSMPDITALQAGTPPRDDRLWVWINSEGKIEPDEGLCLRTALAAGSTAHLQSDKASLTLKDTGHNGGGKLLCTRGFPCKLDLSLSNAVPGKQAFIQLLEQHGDQCLSCRHAYAYNESNLLTFQVTHVNDTTMADLGYGLLFVEPGIYSLCTCWEDPFSNGQNATRQEASLTVSGPYSMNTAYCFRSDSGCTIPWVDAVQPQIGKDHVRVMLSCFEPARTPEGFQLGGDGILSSDGYSYHLNASLMRVEEPGVYQMCWCRESPLQHCDQLEQFHVPAGVFTYGGPAKMNPRSTLLGEPFMMTDIHGTLLRKGDKAMLLPRCGEAHDTAHVISTFNENASTFEFPALSMESGFRARTYHLCWCQVNGNCTSAEHFRAFFGQVRLICPDKQADYNNDGTCSLCPSMLQRPGGMDGMECQMHLSSLLVALSWTLITTLFVFALCASVSLGFRGGSPSLHGKLRRIEDISKERGKLTITTAGLHNLATFGKWPIPVTLWQTGHYLLDSKPSRRLQLYVLISSDQSLEIVDKRGDPASFRADSSMGVLQISFARAMLNSCLPKTKFPLLAQLVLLAAASISLAILLNPQSWEMLLVLGSSICISVLLISIWKLTLRSSTRMDQRLKTYARVLQERNPSPQACPKGPGRAILVWDLLDMFEHFQAQIQDRNMYYIDPNIIRPLTAAKQLSYAELVGPRKVQWFVSHWWGTSFSVYCDALKRHAKAVNEDDEDAWKMTAYWICTFSNNQYQIAEELGKSHEESSFYLALHSGVCRGTCMILDEMAMPLKRSWCLFELLQTVHLEKSQMGFTGLLFCTSNGVLNFGSSTVEMSMRIGERLLDLSLRDAEATTEQDGRSLRWMPAEHGGFAVGCGWLHQSQF
ncbi:unnamed protein product [Effrenium voratum]|nr:unnamed protein product [Effrenium voratum]